MATKIIIPKPEYTAGMEIYGDEPAIITAAMAGSAYAILQDTNFENRELLLSGGLTTTETINNNISPEDIAELRETRQVPRVLESINVILVDDLSEEDESVLRERAEIYENIDIDLIEPVDTDEPDANEVDERWHLTKVWGDNQGERLTGNGTRIGILDTGIDASHPEFAGKHVSFMEFDATGFPISNTTRDAGDHGTHVSGIAAGNTCGVAPDADLAVAAVLTKRTPRGMTGSLAQILAGYNWLIHSNHADPEQPISMCDVINASLGQRGFHPFLYTSIGTSLTLSRSLLIAAIGNKGRRGADNHGSPGNYDTVLAVGATDINDIVAPFSDWGLETTHGAFKPDMSAPGVAVTSSVPGGCFSAKNGTSMAAPMVAGAAALLIEKQASFKRNPQALRRALERSVDTVKNNDPANNSTNPRYSRIGSGRLDLSLI